MEKIRITYRRARVMVEHVKLGYCQACRAVGRTEMHHWEYAYTTAEVRKNPQLALRRTVELCFKCHRIANALRIIEEGGLRSKMVAQVRGSQSC